MRSFVKIYGPPLAKALKELEKLAVNLPQVCIMDTLIVQSVPEAASRVDEIFSPTGSDSRAFSRQYFSYLPTPISEERCNTIISKSGEMLGDYDFFFEWFKEPTTNELNALIEKIDKVLEPLGCKYSLTTKK